MYLTQNYVSKATKPAQSAFVLKVILQIDNLELQKLYLSQDKELCRSTMIYILKSKTIFPAFPA